MDKPLPCFQKYDDMLPADGGRVCMGCGKLVIDFTKSKWEDIEQKHLSKTDPTCGIYNPKQLVYWGKEIPKEKYFDFHKFTFPAIFVSLFQIASSPLFAQKNLSTEKVVVNSTNPKPPLRKVDGKKKIKGVTLMEIGDRKFLPVSNVRVVVTAKNFQAETKSDSLGRFSLDITKKFSSLPDNISVSIVHPDFILYHLIVDKNKLKLLRIILHQADIIADSVFSEPTVIAFYAVPLSDTLKPAVNETKATILPSKKKKKFWPWLWFRK